MKQPLLNDSYIKDLFIRDLGVEPKKITRQLTGLCHYVYHVEGSNNDHYILRAASEENKEQLSGSAYWLKLLADYSLPIPKVIDENMTALIPYQILNYIPGNDLGNVYGSLIASEKKALAMALVSIQETLETIPILSGSGYGYLLSLEDPCAKEGWVAVVNEHTQRSRERILNNGIFDVSYVDRVEAVINRYHHDLSLITAKPFLHDATTKNVLMDQGELAGIVDMDTLCFGDPLYQVALTRMSLLASKDETDYIDYWVEALDLNLSRRKLLDLYTLIFCIDFMAEIGMTFNKEEALTVSEEGERHFISLFEFLIKDL